MSASDTPPEYHAYLLRFWEERGEQGTPTAWRFSLEDPQSGHRQGFADLGSLTAWLQASTERPNAKDEG
jgi:hypothetical protein